VPLVQYPESAVAKKWSHDEYEAAYLAVSEKKFVVLTFAQRNSSVVNLRDLEVEEAQRWSPRMARYAKFINIFESNLADPMAINNFTA
jgi:hypothetical protein